MLRAPDHATRGATPYAPRTGGPRPCLGLGAHGATAPNPPAAASAAVHGAQAKPAHAGAGA
jgi:hypothetical protein